MQVTLTTQQMLGVSDSLAALSGEYDRVIKDGGNERVVRLHYKLPGETVMAIGRNIAALRDPVTAYQEAVHRLQREAADDKGMIPAEKQVELRSQIDAMLKVEGEYNLSPIKEDKLGLDVNTFSPMIVANLLPIMESATVAAEPPVAKAKRR